MSDGLSSVRRPVALILALLLVAAAAFLSTSEARAAAGGTIAGFVEIGENGGTSRYEGVTIRVEDGGSVIADAVTGPDGEYSIDVAAGTFTIAAVPPAASGFTSITESDVVVDDAATTSLNFRFEVVDARVPVTGTVTDGAGNPVGGVSVLIYTLGSGSQPDDGGSAVTAGNGTYRVDVRPKSGYRFTVDAGGVGGLPEKYLVTHDGTQNVPAATVVDVQLPRVPVTVRVEDSRGDPASYSSVSIPETVVSGPAIGSATSKIIVRASNLPTGADGVTSVLLPSGGYSAGAVPAANSGLLNGAETFGVPSADPVVIVLADRPDPTFTRLTAHLEHTDGTPLAGAQFLVLAGATAVADGGGNVDFQAPSGMKQLQVRDPHPKLPQYLMLTTEDDISLVGGGELAVGTVVVPTVETRLRILDPVGDSVSRAEVEFSLALLLSGLVVGFASHNASDGTG